MAEPGSEFLRPFAWPVGPIGGSGKIRGEPLSITFGSVRFCASSGGTIAHWTLTPDFPPSPRTFSGACTGPDLGFRLSSLLRGRILHLIRGGSVFNAILREASGRAGSTPRPQPRGATRRACPSMASMVRIAPKGRVDAALQRPPLSSPFHEQACAVHGRDCPPGEGKKYHDRGRRRRRRPGTAFGRSSVLLVHAALRCASSARLPSAR